MIDVVSIQGLTGPIFNMLYCEFQPVLTRGSVKSKPFPTIPVRFISYNASLQILSLSVWMCGDCCWTRICQARSLSHRCVWVAQGHLWQWCLTPALSRLCLGSLSCWDMNFQPTLSSWELRIRLSWLCSFIFSSLWPLPLSHPQKYTRTPWCCSYNASLYGRASIEQVISGTSLQIEFLEFRSRRSIMVFVAGSGIQ